MSDLTIYYVDDAENGAPYLPPQERPKGVHSASAYWMLTSRALPYAVNREDVVWVVKHGTPAHDYLREHAQGRISSFSVSKPESWLRLVAGNPTFYSNLAADCRPAVKATGLGSTDNGKKIDASVIDGSTITTHTIDASELQSGVNRAFENLNATAKTMGLRASYEPASPHTTLITHMDIEQESYPLDTLLDEALNASRVQDDATLPEDGSITIQWSKVHGRTNLRKFTVTIDYKESN